MVAGRNSTLKMLMLTVVMSMFRSFFIITAMLLFVLFYAYTGVILFGMVKYGQAVSKYFILSLRLFIHWKCSHNFVFALSCSTAIFYPANIICDGNDSNFSQRENMVFFSWNYPVLSSLQCCFQTRQFSDRFGSSGGFISQYYWWRLERYNARLHGDFSKKCIFWVNPSLLVH